MLGVVPGDALGGGGGGTLRGAPPGFPKGFFLSAMGGGPGAGFTGTLLGAFFLLAVAGAELSPTLGTLGRRR